MKAPTVCGLADYLGIHRKTLLEYEEKEEFSDTIKRAKNKIELYLEENLYGNNVAGLIFNLKNNFGWKDKQEIESHNVNENVDTRTQEEKSKRIDELLELRRKKAK